MKIKNIESYIVNNPWKKWVFLQITTDNGLVGYGEATVYNGQFSVKERIKDVRRFIIGRDPFAIERLLYDWFQGTFNRNRDVVNVSLMSGVEVACFDIMGKALGVPVFQLLGGLFRDKVKVYANGWYTSVNTPEEWADAAKTVAQRGYKSLKMDPFGAGSGFLSENELKRSKDIIAAVHDAVGDHVELLIEGHGRFNRAMALTVGRFLENFGNLGWFEEPVIPEDIDGMSLLARSLKIPIAAGERYITKFDFVKPFELGAMHIAQPDIVNTGGLLETKKIACMAEAHNIALAPHQAEGPLNTFATLQLDATVPNLKIQELFDEFAFPEWTKDIIDSKLELDSGYVKIPNKPGIGVELTDRIREHLAKEDDADFNLFENGWEKRGFK